MNTITIYELPDMNLFVNLIDANTKYCTRAQNTRVFKIKENKLSLKLCQAQVKLS